MRYHYISIKTTKINACEDTEKLDLLYVAGVMQNVKWYSHAGKLTFI